MLKDVFGMRLDDVNYVNLLHKNSIASDAKREEVEVAPHFSSITLADPPAIPGARGESNIR